MAKKKQINVKRAVRSPAKALNDITERKRAEEARQESEAHYRELADSITDVFFEMDKDLRYTYWNKASETLIGIRAQDAIGKSLRELFPDTPEIRKTEAVYRDVIRTQQPQTFESIYQARDKRAIFEISVYPSARGISVFTKDITERKRAEEALRESEEKYRSLFENSVMGISQALPNGRLICANTAYAQMYGYANPEEMLAEVSHIGRQLYANPQDREEVLRILKEKGVMEPKEMEVVRRDGSRFFVLVRAREIRDSKGNLLCYQAEHTDITARKRAEETLRESAINLARSQRIGKLGSWDWDIAGNSLTWSDEVYRIWGVEKDFPLTFESIAGMIHPDDRELNLKNVQALLADRDHGEYEFRIICPDQTVKYIYQNIEVTRAPSGQPVKLFGIMQDITERKRAEEALYQRQHEFAALVENAPDSIVRFDISLRHLYVNRAMERLSGLSKSAYLGKTNEELGMPPDLVSFWNKELNEVIQTAALKIIPFEFIGADGILRYFEARVVPEFSGDGKVVSLLSIVRDITARKRAEEALAQERNLLRTLFDHLPDSVWVKDIESRFVIGNLGVARHVGAAAPEEIIGKRDYDFYPKDLAEQYYADEQQVVRSGQSLLNREEMVEDQTTGKRLWNLATKVPLRNAEGNIVGIVGIGRDITERKRAEETLRESERKFSVLFEKSAFAASLSRRPDGVFVNVNETFEKAFGYTRQEALGKTSLELGINPDAEGRARILALLKEHGSVSNLELALRTKSDETRLFSVNIDLVDIGDEQYILNTAQDITERKRAEETSRQRLVELEAVHTVSAALRTAQTLDEALPILLDQTLAALETNAGTIWLYHPASRELRAAVNRGWFSQFDDAPMKPGEGIAGTVFASGQAHLSAEFARDLLARPPAIGEIPAGWGGACVPIRTTAETVGVLFVSVPLPRQITPEQMKLLNSLAEMAGAALHRMRLYEETVRHLKYLQALHEIDRVISASFDLRMTLNLLIDHVITQLGVDAADVLLLRPHMQTLDYAAGHGFRTRAIQDTHLRLGENLAGRVAVERRTIQVPGPVMVEENTRFAALWAAESFVTYYGIPLIFKGQVKGVLEIFGRTPLSPSGEKSEWLGALETFAAQAAIAIDNTQLFENLQRSNLELAVAYDTTIEGWARALEVRDWETQGHTARVAEMTVRLAKALNLGEAAIVHIRRGALLHDIGKLGVPDSILLKPDKLTDEEWAVMRQHPQLAHDLLAPIAYLHPALDIPHCHHEKWDGTGYPRGLQGEQIPLAARLFAIVDVWDALISDRPYRPAWSRDKAMEHIREQSGKHFDPHVVETFLREIVGE